MTCARRRAPASAAASSTVIVTKLSKRPTFSAVLDGRQAQRPAATPKGGRQETTIALTRGRSRHRIDTAFAVSERPPRVRRTR